VVSNFVPEGIIITYGVDWNTPFYSYCRVQNHSRNHYYVCKTYSKLPTVRHANTLWLHIHYRQFHFGISPLSLSLSLSLSFSLNLLLLNGTLFVILYIIFYFAWSTSSATGIAENNNEDGNNHNSSRIDFDFNVGGGCNHVISLAMVLIRFCNCYLEVE
jgi:hypothetical protein